MRRGVVEIANRGERTMLGREIAAAAVLTCASLAAATPALIEIAGPTMGTSFSAKYWTIDERVDVAEVRTAIDALLARFDRQMSTYRPDSELMRFAAAPAGAWFEVSDETARAVAHALKVNRLTKGASDVTIGPVLRAWKFGPGGARVGARAVAPDKVELASARARTGAEHLQARLNPPALRKDLDGLEVDLSSLAPGFAIDQLIDVLRSRGIEDAIVEVGGEVRAVGARSDGSPWRVGVESVPGSDAKFVRVVALRDLALATSGDYRDVRTIDGVRYAHVIDPRTGRPLVCRGTSVTVLAATCLEADALGTPLLIMGDEAGVRWCEAHDVAALFQKSGAAGVAAVVRATPKFIELTRDRGEIPSGNQGVAAE